MDLENSVIMTVDDLSSLVHRAEDKPAPYTIAKGVVDTMGVVLIGSICYFCVKAVDSAVAESKYRMADVTAKNAQINEELAELKRKMGDA